MLRWPSRDFEGDAASEVIERAAASVNLDTQLAQLRSWAAAPADRKAQWKKGC